MTCIGGNESIVSNKSKRSYGVYSKSLIYVGLMTLKFIKQLIDGKFTKRTIAYNTGLNISPAFSEDINELDVMFNGSSDYIMISVIIDVDS